MKQLSLPLGLSDVDTPAVSMPWTTAVEVLKPCAPLNRRTILQAHRRALTVLSGADSNFAAYIDVINTARDVLLAAMKLTKYTPRR
jgi:hypothetical protein